MKKAVVKRLLLYLSILFCAVPIFAAKLAAVPPDVVLTGTVTSATGVYPEVPFDVPSGIRRITVTFSYTGREEKTTLDLGIADPQRFRGWSGGDKSGFTIATSDATPSFLPGPVVAGRWRLLIGVANLRPGQASQYRAEIRFERVGQHQAEGFADAPISSQPGWYRGDLHMHTAHSDGFCTSQTGRQVPCPLFVTVREAAEKGLDFIAITDHNTTSHYDAMRELQPYFDKLLLIPGRELTTYRGHANMFGVTEFLDFRAAAPDWPDVSELFGNAHALGALVSINHPVRPDDERCMGCGWIAGDTGTRTADAVEVMNSDDRRLDAADIAFWQHLLASGSRPTAIGGSDTHRPERGTIGRPTTIVHADSLSVEAILAAIRAGHVVIDADGTKDRLLTLEAHSDKQRAEIGDSLDAPHSRTVEFQAQVHSAAGATLQVLLDGNESQPLFTATSHSEDETFVVKWVSDGQRHWIRTQVRGADGHLELFANPIYINWPVKKDEDR